MKLWLLSVSIFLVPFMGIGQEKPANFSKLKSKLAPSKVDEGILLGFYDGEKYSTHFFKIPTKGQVSKLRHTNFLASPQHDGFHYYQQQQTSKINYNNEEDDIDIDYNYSCYDASSNGIVSGTSVRGLYKTMFENKLEEYQNKLNDLEKFQGPNKDRLIECFLYEDDFDEIVWIVPGFMQTSSLYNGFHGGAHGDYGAHEGLHAIGENHEPVVLTEKLFRQKDSDKNWQNIKMQAYIKALTLDLDENYYAVSPGEEDLEFDFIVDSLEFEEIEPEYPIDDYDDIDYKFVHKNGRLHLGVVFSASAPYILSHTYEFTGTVDAGPIQNKMIGYNGVDMDFGIGGIHQLSPGQNVIVMCEGDGEETILSFFDIKTGEFVHSESIPGHPVMLEWCSEKHISSWEEALQDDFTKIIE